MAFITDKQTLEDLNLVGKFRPNSVFSMFNRVHTAGGERLLEQWFREPLTAANAINTRSAQFLYFQEKQLPFPVSAKVFHTAAHYLGSSGNSSYPGTLATWLRNKTSAALLRDERYQFLDGGLQAVALTLRSFRSLLVHLDSSPLAHALRQLLDDPRLELLLAGTALTLLQKVRYDHLLRHTLRNMTEKFLEAAYEIDVCIAVSAVAQEKGFTYATALPPEQQLAEIRSLWHPALENAVGNDLQLTGHSNLLFLTGANMAGKSTLMKSFGIALYLAHMGFPVAAAQMRFSVKDGLYSSINVADNLQQGYSHFYAEVLRVKMVAQAVSSGKRIVVIFDELFKGTNVKDAYDGTLAVTAAFARYRDCLFIVSTHIVEVGNALKDNDNIQFVYMPTVMDGAHPRYTYQLQQGITEDRQGMMIIRNEGILELLRDY